jgi:hypothetical protein
MAALGIWTRIADQVAGRFKVRQLRSGHAASTLAGSRWCSPGRAVALAAWFDAGTRSRIGRVVVAASSVAVVAVVAAIIVVALVVWYVLPRGPTEAHPARR